MHAQPAKAVDEAKLQAFLGKVVTDFGAAMSCQLVLMGERLGLYKALRERGPLTSAQLAEATGTTERYVREWLMNQASGGYLEYDPESRAYELPPEQAVALTEVDSPYCVAGGFSLVSALARAHDRIEESFRTGKGMLWGEHHPSLFDGTERFFRATYLGHLVADWLPSLQGVVPKLQAGAKVADVGCGHGASTLIMASAFPASRFTGFDNHAPSIERARKAAKDAGVGDRVTFEVAPAVGIPAGGFDLVAYFDCLHDMGDPVGALKAANAALGPGGTVMIVEPMAGARTEDNFNIVGRVFSAASTLCCTPNAMASGSVALGTCATDEALEDVAKQAGLTHFRRAWSDMFNRVFEASR